MKLVVSSNPNVEEDLDTVKMAPEDFNHLHAHPYILTSGFSEVQIDLDADIDYHYVERLSQRIYVRPIYSTLDISGNAILILSYIYPDKSTTLRFFSASNREKLINLLSEMAKEFEWRKVDV